MAPLPDLPWFVNAAKGQRYLAGVSGGADSVALLHLLHAHGFEDIIVCHLNHSLRGEEADADHEFVASLAGRLGYSCAAQRIDVRERMAATGQSMETAARDARHEFFASAAAVHGSNAVLLGHHRDDQAETILWNLLRGSRGLAGMKEIQTIELEGGVSLDLLRPLLGTTRAELRAWLTENGHTWREDASNSEPVAARNRLRNEALPLLEEIAKREVRESIVRAEEATRELLEIQAWAITEARVMDPQGRLHLPTLTSLPGALQAACVHDYLRSQGIPDLSREIVSRCVEVISGEEGHMVNLPGGKRFKRRQGRAYITA